MNRFHADDDTGLRLAFDYEGTPISLTEWAQLQTPASRVGNAYVGRVRIATDWIGQDIGVGHARPMIYETMLFPRRRRDKNATWTFSYRRYPTRVDALAGHIALVNRIRARGVEPLLRENHAAHRELLRLVELIMRGNRTSEAHKSHQTRRDRRSRRRRRRTRGPARRRCRAPRVPL